MARRPFAGMEVVEVLIDVGGFEWRRPTGDHAQVYYEHPTNENDRRQVTIPYHDELRTGTLREIADPAGARDFESVCDWIDRTASTVAILSWINHDLILSPWRGDRARLAR